MQGGNHAVGPEDVSAAEGAGRERRRRSRTQRTRPGGLAPLRSAAVCRLFTKGLLRGFFSIIYYFVWGSYRGRLVILFFQVGFIK